MLDSCARDATDEAAYVARLTLEDADSSNAETWIVENISSCGVLLRRWRELRLYGT